MAKFRKMPFSLAKVAFLATGWTFFTMLWAPRSEATVSAVVVFAFLLCDPLFLVSLKFPFRVYSEGWLRFYLHAVFVCAVIGFDL